MDFKQLKSFAAVVEYQNFSKAAERLHIAQPTISTHVRMLEEELNTRLILRTTKSLEITPQGWDAYRYAVKILDLKDRILDSCSADSRNIIRIGASTIPSAYILPEVMSRYGEVSPNTYFVINQIHGNEVVDGVMDGQFDVGLTGAPADREGLVCLPLYENRLVMITPVNERFIRLQHQCASPLQELLKEPMVLREVGSKKSANQYLDAMGISEDRLQVVARVNDQETVKNMVARGMGVSLISEIAARDFVKERRLLKFSLPDYDSQQHIYLVYRSRFGSEPKVQDFVNFLQRYEVR